MQNVIFHIVSYIQYDVNMGERENPSTSPAGAPEPRAAQRSYRSPLRDERATDTRQRIVAATRDLFAARGFAGTTMASIAEEAGVSQPTVYAVFGSKGAIMRALLTQLEDDADAAGWKARIESEPDPRQKLERFAQWSRQLFSTDREVTAAALGAGSEPSVAELNEQGDQNRREWLGPVVTSLAAANVLRTGLSEQEALDRAWMLTGPELYFRATDGCGWSNDTYQRWLTGLLQDQLLHSPAGDAETTTTTGATG